MLIYCLTYKVKISLLFNKNALVLYLKEKREL